MAVGFNPKSIDQLFVSTVEIKHKTMNLYYDPESYLFWIRESDL